MRDVHLRDDDRGLVPNAYHYLWTLRSRYVLALTPPDTVDYPWSRAVGEHFDLMAEAGKAFGEHDQRALATA